MNEFNVTMTLEEHTKELDRVRSTYNSYIANLHRKIFTVCNQNEEAAKKYRLAADSCPKDDPSLRAMMIGQCMGLMEANRNILKLLEKNEVDCDV